MPPLLVEKAAAQVADALRETGAEIVYVHRVAARVTGGCRQKVAEVPITKACDEDFTDDRSAGAGGTHRGVGLSGCSSVMSDVALAS